MIIDHITVQAMKLTEDRPTTWQDLQEYVCRFLNEAGYKAVSPKSIKTARDIVEVDVYATSENEILKTFICECKNWKTKVPKEKVNAFRTVVQDSGATLGIMISSMGYQKGAYSAAKYSNVILKDWDGFLEIITNQWLKERLIHLKKEVKHLRQFMDILKPPQELFSKKESKQEYESLLADFMSVYKAAGLLSYGLDFFPDDAILVDNIRFTDYSSLFNHLESRIKEAFSSFIALYNQYKIPLPDLSNSEEDYDNVTILKNKIIKQLQ